MLSQQLHLCVVLTLTLLATLAAHADNNNQIPTSVGEPEDSGWSLQLDDDLFIPKKQDRDYTGGLSFTFSGKRVQRWFFSLDPALQKLNHWLSMTDGNGESTLHSLQIGIAAFAPQNIKQSTIIVDDRPYASLVYLANSQENLQDDGRTAIQSTLTVGLLGTGITKVVQKNIHQLTQSEPPNGWSHQIADGGEPTVRYTYAHQRLWLATQHHQSSSEIKLSNEVSVGFLTEFNTAFSFRWGIIKTPWWSFAPDRAEYFSQPSTGLLKIDHSPPSEFYIWTGAKIRVRAYNVFLQGQFRDSELRYDWQEVRPILAEAWLGVTKQVTPHTRLSWILRYQSSELRGGNGDRELLWGSILLNRDF